MHRAAAFRQTAATVASLKCVEAMSMTMSSVSLNSAHMFECRDGLAVNEISSIVIFTGGDGENHGRMAAFLCLLLAHFPRDR